MMKKKLFKKIAIGLIVLFVIFRVGVELRNYLLQSAAHSINLERYEKANNNLHFLCLIGDSTACLFEGDLYAHGWGVKKDNAKAKRLFEKSAKGDSIGVSYAMFGVGERYLGMHEDNACEQRDCLSEAIMWLSWSVDMGNPKARALLDNAEKIQRK
ncbi:tetratricopeptide repeat protein [Nitrospirota bacterium]